MGNGEMSDPNISTLLDLLIKAEVDGQPRHELIIDFGSTPEILMQFGFTQRRLILKGKAVGKIFFDHAIVQRLIEKIPDMVASPKAIYKSASRPDETVVVMTYELQRGHPIVIVVAKDQPYGRDTVNEVVTMYGKEEPDVEANWTRRDLRLWVSPKPNR